MIGLKPCPFCGKEVFLLDVATRSSANAKWDVYCRTHGCFLNSGTNTMFSNREEAVIAWNTRAEPPELIALREQVRVLREALGEAVEHLEWVGYGDSYERECARDTGLIDRLDNALEQTSANFSTDRTVIKDDPEKLAKLIADLDAIFGKGSIKAIHLRKYLSDPANVDHLRLGAQAKPKGASDADRRTV